jgi:nicotinate-nucleotide adenylyltransferase
MRIGICGGTFDPFHRGHLDPILAVRDEMQWDRILYVPAFIQPFKQERDTASAYHRFTMSVLGTEAYDDMRVETRELDRGAVSYTVDTLRELRAEYATDTLDWIIGDDNLEKLHEWKSIDTIFELANFVVLTRKESSILNPQSSIPEGLPDCECDAADRPKNGAIVYAHNPTVPVSSTEIRARVRAGEPIDELVGARVSRYIDHYGLYRKGQS